ncbi:MAG: hypothetical protein AAB776_00210 [Patescibacteria group bacterium]
MRATVLSIPVLLLALGGCRGWFEIEPLPAADTDTDTIPTGTTIPTIPTTPTTGDTSVPVTTGDTGVETVIVTTGDTGTTTSTGDTGVLDTDTPLDTGDTAEPCVLIDWYLDVDGDGIGNAIAVPACFPPLDHVATGGDCDDFDASVQAFTDWYIDADGDGFTDPDTVVNSCGSQGIVAYRPSPSAEPDCDDADAAVNPNAVENDSNGIDDDCDEDVDECAAGFVRLSGTYVAPAGATSIVVSAEHYAAGSGIAAPVMSPIVNGVNGWTLDASVPGQVAFANSICYSDIDQWYASASFAGAAVGYSCMGTANPAYTPYGTFTFEWDGVSSPNSPTYVNNYETPIGFPYGYGNGCEVKIN